MLERAFVGRRGEADLVVDDDVERAAGRVAGELAEVERLLHDPFAGERGVAVDQQRHAAARARDRRRGPAWRARGRCATGLTNSRWLGLKQSDRCTLRAVGGRPVAAVAQVILHVAAAAVQLRVDVLELAEDLARALAHDVGQHVEPAAMGHAQHDLVDALLAGLLDRQVQQRDQALGPFQRKALRADELLLDELLEDHGVGQPREDAQLLVAGERRGGSRCPPCGPAASARTPGRRCA